MKTVIPYKSILNIAIPIILSGVAQNIVIATDTMFLGRLGDTAIGAAGNAGIFYFVLIMMGMGLTTGSQIIIARRNGEHNYNAIGSVFRKTMGMLLPAASIIFIFLLLFSPSILGKIVQSDAILTLSNDYISHRAFGIFFAYVNFCFIAFYVGTTHTRALTYGTIIMAGVNILLDYVLIFGKFGLPEMGVKGAAMASSLADVFAFIFFVFYTLRYTDIKKYQLLKREENAPKASYFNILKVGSPIILQNVLTLGSWMTFFIFIEHLGEKELAVSHIIRSIYMILMIPMMGLTQTTNSLVSNFIGEGRQAEVFSLIKQIALLGACFTFLMVGLAWVFPNTLISIYTKDPILIEGTYSVLKVISFSIFFFCLSYILFSGVTGTGKTNVSLLIEFINISIYLVSTYFIAFHLDASIEQVWCSEFIYFTFLGIMSFVYLKKGNWQNASI